MIFEELRDEMRAGQRNEQLKENRANEKERLRGT